MYNARLRRNLLDDIGVPFFQVVWRCATITHRCDAGYVTIDMLPDEVLLGIFAFYLCEDGDEEVWQKLVQVCRRWRFIVFASPRRLDLRIVRTYLKRTR